MTDRPDTTREARPPAAPASEAEERLRLLTEAVSDHGIFLMDAEGRITWWGEGAVLLSGYPADEAVGRSGAMLFTEEDRAAGLLERELRTAAASGRAADENWAVRK